MKHLSIYLKHNLCTICVYKLRISSRNRQNVPQERLIKGKTDAFIGLAIRCFKKFNINYQFCH